MPAFMLNRDEGDARDLIPREPTVIESTVVFGGPILYIAS